MSEKKVGPFDLIDSASHTKVDMMREDPSLEKIYSPYLTNRSLSYHSDAVLYANEMNAMHHLDPRMQYDYLRLSLRARSRRSRWAKPEDQEAIDSVSWMYDMSPSKARAAILVMRDEHVEEIKKIKAEACS